MFFLLEKHSSLIPLRDKKNTSTFRDDLLNAMALKHKQMNYSERVGRSNLRQLLCSLFEEVKLP